MTQTGRNVWPGSELLIICYLMAVMAASNAGTCDHMVNSWQKQSCTITGRKYVFVGEDAELNCTLTEDFLQKNCTAHDIWFTHYQSKTESINISDLQISNRSAILIIHNITLEDYGNYFCFTDKGRVGTFLMKVEHAPMNVTDFQCVHSYYSVDNNMSCTWTHPVQYVNDSDVNVTVTYNSTKGGTFQCPNLSSYKCEWPIATGLLECRIYVTVTNTRTNTSAMKYFDQNLFTIVKFEPVQNLTVMLKQNTTCLMLSWRHIKIYSPKIYRIKQHFRENDSFEILTDNETNTSFTVCGYGPHARQNFPNRCYHTDLTDCAYHPHTLHNFSVDCYPSGNQTGYWSDPVYADNWTSTLAPDFGPGMINGSFVTGQCISEMRNVTLFWQAVEESVRNGIIDSYYIKEGDITKKVVSNDTYSAVIEVQCSLVSVSIFAHNEVGLSLTPSILLVPDPTVSVPEKIKNSFAVGIHSSKSLKAEWTVVDGETEHQNYTVFWCQGTSDQLCLGPINWTSVMGSERYVNIPIPFDDRLKFIYGISITNTNTEMASQIFWTLCLFEVALSPSSVPDVQDLRTEAGQNRIYVSWKSYECNYSTKKKVDTYLLKYCLKDDCNNTVKEVKITGNESNYIITNLEASSNYLVTLQPHSGGFKGMEVKPWKMATPVAEFETSETSIIAAVAGTIGGIGLLILLFYLGKKFKDGYDQMKNKCNVELEMNSLVLLDRDREIPTREATSDRNFQTRVSRPSEENVQIQDNSPSVSVYVTQCCSVDDTVLNSSGDSSSREKLLRSEASTQHSKPFQIQEAIPMTACNDGLTIHHKSVASVEESTVDAERQSCSFVNERPTLKELVPIDLKNSDPESLPLYSKVVMGKPLDQSGTPDFQPIVVQYVSQDTSSQFPGMNTLKHSDSVSHCPGTHYSQLAAIKNSDYGSNGHEGIFEDTALKEAANGRGTDFSVVTTTLNSSSVPNQPNSLSHHENSSVTLNNGAEDNSPTGISTLKYSDYVSHYPDMHYSQLAAIKNPDYGSNGHEGIFKDMPLIEAANRTDFSVVTQNSSSVLDQPNSLPHHENSSVTLNDGAEDNSPASGQTDYIFCNGVPAFNTPANFQPDFGDDGYKPSSFIC